MRFLFVTLVAVLAVSCENNGGASGEKTAEDIVDTTTIIEYNLDGERLSAVAYNNKLSLMQQRVLNQIDILFQSDTGQTVVNHENAQFEIELNLTDLKAIQAPEGGESFKNTLLDLFEFYQMELNNGFKAILPLLDKTDLSVSESKKLDEYSEHFAQREEELFGLMADEQKEFAKANNFKIQ